jgi:methylmalonyl-CoA/ethylmalonyl-CoA epimerase
MMAAQITHIGIVVRDLDAAVKLWSENFGMKEFRRTDIAAEGIRSAFLSPQGTPDEMHIELMEPTDKADLSNAVARRLAQAGEGFYHLALRVDDVEGTGKTLAGKGLTVIERAPVAEGAKLRWVVHPKSSSGVLVELI